MGLEVAASGAMTVKLRCARFLRGEESSVEGRGDDDGEVDPLA
jgi:hypothetical protein